MTKESPKLSDQITFALIEFDKQVINVLADAVPPGKWAAINAVRHLNRAWKLRHIDDEMALFRSITAQEEAASAIFLSLKRLRYPNAGKLNHRNHVDKNALFPFLNAVSLVFARQREHLPKTKITFNTQSPPRLRISIQVPQIGWVQPEPPLHFSLRGGPKERRQQLFTFREEMKETLRAPNDGQIEKALKKQANERNRALYSSSEGIPGVTGDITEALELYQQQTLIMVRLFLLVDAYPEHQLFVQQGLDAFLRVLRRLPADIDFQ